jgi:biotin carboxyl carrier protein
MPIQNVAPVAAVRSPVVEENNITIKSPIIGLFIENHLHKPMFVEVGTLLEKEMFLCN